MTAPATALTGPISQHPSRLRWVEDETLTTATYHATRRHLAPFLVPHRFEGDAAKIRPVDLRRAKIGYGIALNRTYLTEVHGHLKNATATYAWGKLSGGDDLETGAPTSGLAAVLWADATLDGTSWKRLIEERALVCATAALGGFLVPDTNKGAMAQLYGPLVTQADEAAAGVRPFARFVPWSAVEDFGWGARGYRWITLGEDCDTREPGGEGEIVHHSVTYQLTAGGETTVTRTDSEGKVVGVVVNMGQICDAQGEPMLALVPCKIGEHPDIPQVGAGLLLGLADIVVDLFNTLSEMREGYRDATFSVFTHKGPDSEKVRDALASGSRFLALGEDAAAELQRLAVDSAEVATGLSLLELGVKMWAMSAKRQAEQAAAGSDRSGTSLVAEFQLDLKPMLVNIVERLDEAETALLRILAQLAGHSWQDAAKITVTRDTQFRLEDEASRITRIVTEFVAALPDVLPPEAKVQMLKRWLEASNLLDLDAPADKDADGTGTLGEVIEAQARDAIDAAHQATLASAGFAASNPGGVPPGEAGLLATKEAKAGGDAAYGKAAATESEL